MMGGEKKGKKVFKEYIQTTPPTGAFSDSEVESLVFDMYRYVLFTLH